LTRSPRRCARRRPGRHGPGADGPRRWHGRRSPPGGRAQRRHAQRGRAAPGEPFTAGDQRLLAALAPQVAVIIRVLQPTGSLERERDRVLTEAHPDRHRIRRDLHDGLGPSLTRIGSGLQAVQAQLRSEPTPRGVVRLALRGRGARSSVAGTQPDRGRDASSAVVPGGTAGERAPAVPGQGARSAAGQPCGVESATEAGPLRPTPVGGPRSGPTGVLPEAVGATARPL
jgi:hypothetical protein